MTADGHSDFSSVTEIPGNRLRREALAMMQARYDFAAELARGRDVLEVACGAGMGLGRLASTARRVVGGDYDLGLLAVAHGHYRSRVPLVRLDGTSLPFRDGSFDVVLLYEAVYYLPDARDFVADARRVLRAGGVLAVCSSNVEWVDFNPSPHSVRYFSAAELRLLLEDAGFRVEMLGAFPDRRDSLRDRVVSILRRVAVRLHLVPRTMAGKAWLKRLFYGSLAIVPPELAAAESLPPFDPLRASVPASDHKVIYAVGHR